MAKSLIDVAASVTPTDMTSYGESAAIKKTKKELAKDKLEKFIKEETVMVKGVFQNHENPGCAHPVNVRKYPGIPIFSMSMMDGCEYEIPLYVARFLNGIDVLADAVGGKIGTCSYPVHGFISKGNNLAPSTEGMAPGFSGIPVPIVGVAKRVKRFGFNSMQFAGAAA